MKSLRATSGTTWDTSCLRSQLHKGGIVLMHEIQPITPRDPEVIITRILAGGFTFESLDDAGFASSTR